MKRFFLCCGLLASAALLVAQSRNSYGPGRTWWDASVGGFLSREEDYENAEGLMGMRNASGRIRTDEHAFFAALGTNGRACVTCHQPSHAMSVTAEVMRQRWAETQGKDPIFAAIDGSNCPTLPQEEVKSHSLAIDRGLFRIALPWPPANVNPEFTIELVSDPTTCNSDATYGIKGTKAAISVFRRPRIVANFGANTSMALMSDGREATLQSQAITAALTHEQAKHPDIAQLAQIVEFERQMFVAQTSDLRAGLLNESGGPSVLGADNLLAGNADIGREIAPEGWTSRPTGIAIEGTQKEFRESVVRGSHLFGNNCVSCHNDRSARKAMDIGTTNQLSDVLPVFKVTCATTGKVILTQDPGRGLITGKCADVGAIVPQQLRGLAARAPYFVNGSAGTLLDVIEFYDRRYSIGYSTRDKQDLVNFLKVL